MTRFQSSLPLLIVLISLQGLFSQNVLIDSGQVISPNAASCLVEINPQFINWVPLNSLSSTFSIDPNFASNFETLVNASCNCGNECQTTYFNALLFLQISNAAQIVSLLSQVNNALSSLNTACSGRTNPYVTVVLDSSTQSWSTPLINYGFLQSIVTGLSNYNVWVSSSQESWNTIMGSYNLFGGLFCITDDSDISCDDVSDCSFGSFVDYRKIFSQTFEICGIDIYGLATSYGCYY